MTLEERALKLHRDNVGKLAVVSKVPAATQEDLTLAYSPGVAAPCLEIQREPSLLYEYTAKSNMVAVISNGTAVLGLGDIGAAASLPVMEGKAVLFKAFAGIDSIPLCIDSKDVDTIVNTVSLITSSLGGINLEDIKAPECFEIEERLKAMCDIPVFHDDQHGTAVIAVAGLMNALQLVGKRFETIKVAMNGAGAAGVAIAKLLVKCGVRDIVLCDRKGAIYKGRPGDGPDKQAIASYTNPHGVQGTLADAMNGADVFLGVSAPGCVTQEMVRGMANDAIVFAMCNPVPEIMPDDAKAAGAAIVATGRSDFPNQVNNVTAFPGIFRGALDVRAREINDDMKLAAAHAIAQIGADGLSPEHIVPQAVDRRVAPLVAQYVAQAALDTGVARLTDVDPKDVYAHTVALTQD